ncbi:3071_t:CDS:2 [Paraglomus brasilianum]|uniref:Mitochondrial import inner membrane translocase subunit Tim21 n=1 Tax=Paraglomus brasilianum TaxID=144538 RepID=A0A9N8ZFH8_9GLOM|nr:3071_t:CDS:2 [Paraglomus brasilianum]
MSLLSLSSLSYRRVLSLRCYTHSFPHIPASNRSCLLSRRINSRRSISVSVRKEQGRRRTALVERDSINRWENLTPREKVVGATKTTFSFGVIALSIGICGTVFYLLINELFSPSGSTKVFGEALEKIRAHPQCQEDLGTPIKGHGAPGYNRRQRSRRVRLHNVMKTDGTEHRVMTFYVEGPVRYGMAYLDQVKDEEGNWKTESLVVDLPANRLHLARRIFVEYNRNEKALPKEGVK